jgi:hypothetical protein
MCLEMVLDLLALVRLPTRSMGYQPNSGSTDGGGARSLSQLRIIHDTIIRLQGDLYPGDPDKVVLPCECFDLMGGSDTGAYV